MITINIPIWLITFVLGCVAGIVGLLFLAWLMAQRKFSGLEKGENDG